MKKPKVQSYHLAGNRKCLGWCNGEFYSLDKTRIHFCDVCEIKKEKLEKEGRTKGRLVDNSMGNSDE